MPDLAGWIVLLGGALAGSVLGGVAGFGAGVVLLPLVAWTLGLRAAVPVLTTTMLVGNLSRYWWSRRDVDGAVVLRYLVGSVPATVLGAILYAGVASEWLGRIIGLFLVAAVPLRRLLTSRWFRMRRAHFVSLGAAIGFLSSLVVTTGPVSAPFFLAYGLRRGAFIATESACAVVMHVVRGAVLARYRLLALDTLVLGLALGATMFVGSWIARRLLERMSERLFLAVIETLLVVLGLQFLLRPG